MYAPPAESLRARVIGWMLAFLLALGFWVINLTYNVEAHGGVDQHGYLVGGKLMAEDFTAGFVPKALRAPAGGAAEAGQDVYRFVGRMWVGTDLDTPRERFYPKYPLGLPLVVMALLKAGGTHAGLWAYWISPVAMTLALLGVYYLARQFLSSFLSLLVLMVVATSPVTLGLTTNPNSHALTLLCVTWGMGCLLAWLRLHTWGHALLAGSLLGYAMTIRYTEGLLLLPVAAAAVFMIREVRGQAADIRRQAWGQALALLGMWTLPGILLVSYNFATVGSLTGYDPTNESTGFAWSYFAANWDKMLRQLHTSGMIFLFPLGIAGLVYLFFERGRLAVTLALWIVPNLLLYSAYYWAPDLPNSIGYLRFFLTVLPGLAVAAFWLFAPHRELAPPPVPAAGIARRRAAALAAGLLAAGSCALQLTQALPLLESDYGQRQGLIAAREALRQVAPADSVVLAADQTLLHQLHFTEDYLLYDPQIFNYSFVQRLTRVDPEEPQTWQPQRQLQLLAHFRKVGLEGLDLGAQPPQPTPADMVKWAMLDLVKRQRAERNWHSDFEREQTLLLEAERTRLLTDALTKGKRVFVVLPAARAERELAAMMANAKLKLAREGKPIATIQNPWPGQADRGRAGNLPGRASRPGMPGGGMGPPPGIGAPGGGGPGAVAGGRSLQRTQALQGIYEIILQENAHQ